MVILFEVAAETRPSGDGESLDSREKTAFVGIESVASSGTVITPYSVSHFEVLFDAISSAVSVNQLCRTLAECGELFGAYCFRCTTQIVNGDPEWRKSSSVAFWNSDGLNVEYMMVGSPSAPSIKVLAEEQAVCALSVGPKREIEDLVEAAVSGYQTPCSAVGPGWAHSGAEIFRASTEFELAPFSLILVPDEIAPKFRHAVQRSQEFILGKSTIAAVGDIVSNGIEQSEIASVLSLQFAPD